LLAVKIPERPGSFRQFCHTIGQRSITEFNYRYADNEQAVVFAGIRLTDGLEEKPRLIKKLAEKQYTVIDLSDNEMAKSHVRHMVGGHAANLTDECLYRFEFPERPGALLHFLTSMSQKWNISLFHYQNHGSAYGRVLVGIQVPETELDAFHAFLTRLGYTYWEESNNPAYQLFLN